MGGHPPSEDVEDDDMEFLAAAQEDDDLVARILIRLSRSETPPKPMHPSPVMDGAARPLLLPVTRWGGRRARSRAVTVQGVLAAKREDAVAAAAATAGGRVSPTTPLSWSGGSGSSGSVCGDGRPASSGPPTRRGEPSSQDRREAELCNGSEIIRAPPGKRLTAEVHGDGSSLRRVASAAGVAFFSGYGSKRKAVEMAVGGPETSRTAMQVEPLRLRWAASARSGSGSGSVSVGFRRPGKKKTVAELQALQESLSQEQEELQKELVKRKEIYHALLEENMRLKKVESSVASDIVSKRTVACGEEANGEWPQLVESTSESQTLDEISTVCIMPEEDRHEQLHCTSSPVSLRGHMFLFDLNCLPDEYA